MGLVEGVQNYSVLHGKFFIDLECESWHDRDS